MFKSSCFEVQAWLRSMSSVKNVLARPILLCQECQQQFSTMKKHPNVHIFKKLKHQKLRKPLLTGSCLSFPLHSCWQLNAPWGGCLVRHLASAADKPPELTSLKQTSDGKVASVSSTGKISSSASPSPSPTSLEIGAASPPRQEMAAARQEAAPSSLPQQEAAPTSSLLGAASAGMATTEATEADAAEKKKNKLLRVTPRMRKPNPIDYSYTGNIYILPQRAITEYLLLPTDLEELPKYSRRSPYAEGNRITLYLRSDVEDIAISKWGSFDKLNKEKARLRNLESSGRYDIMDLRSLLGEAHTSSNYVNTDDPRMQPTAGPNDNINSEEKEPTFWSSGSTRVVLSAVLVNGANSLFKLIAWLYTGSHSMFSEFIHSCADTMNQIILGIGLYHSFKKPDTDHPYGYRNLRNISSLISGVGIFFFGTGLSYYHSLQGFLHPQDLGNLHWCIATLIGSFISEGATLIIAVNQVRRSANSCKMGFIEYLMRGMDPNVNVVLLEDFAAVLGVGIAGTCISVSAMTGSSFADALGSALIGTLLGSVAAFIVHQNTLQLVGRSIPMEERQDISQLLETDRMIRSLHDIKATQMGGVVRFKAEVDFDGREITRAYLYKQDMELLLLEAQNLKTVEELENFMLNHGEKIVDALGAEVDRIEKSLKAKHPEIRHVDLEAL